MKTPAMRTLHRAAELLGGEAALAEALGVGVEELQGWLGGASTPPARVYLKALEIVAKGPFNPRLRTRRAS
jgi:hypothetical protein